MYNIDITSDIHSTFIKNNFKEIFWNNWVLKQSEKWKYLIIAWDINEDISEIEKNLNNIINNTSYKKIIITFWNHDIWYNPRVNNVDKNLSYSNSIEKYNFLIDYFHGYNNKVFVIDKEDFIIEDKKIVITWNMWWYNYTIKPEDKQNLEKLLKVNFDDMRLFSFRSNDKPNILFSDDIKSNEEFSKLLEDKLIERLDSIKENPNLKDYKIICISHVKPSFDLDTNSKYYINLNSLEWKEIFDSNNVTSFYDTLTKLYSNAFYTNSNLHKIYKDYNVSIWIYWHTHHNFKKNLDWIKYITNSLGYYLIEHNNQIVTI